MTQQDPGAKPRFFPGPPPAPPRFRIAACTGTHIGDRGEQQDRAAILSSKRTPGAALVVVADGMGGKTGGAIAAQQVISTAQHLFNEYSPKSETVDQLLRAIAHEAHTVIKLSALSTEKEPHSTMVAMLISGNRADWAHIGDSRLYLFNGVELAHRTHDHSYVNELVREGRLKPEQAKNHRMSNVLTSALGTDKTPQITFGSTDQLDVGMSFLLCTDGLWHYFSDQELGNALAKLPPRSASEKLIETARSRARGRGDNCTLAIVKLDPPA
jgi:serine/threonine protein phosphatase PrpC